MKHTISLLTLTAALFCGAAQAKSPNIVFFLVDDLGWSDVGCYGSDFYETPNIDLHPHLPRAFSLWETRPEKAIY